MGCPTCGGQVREPIAPGYFRCRTERLEPGAGPNGSVVGYTVRCDREYADRSADNRSADNRHVGTCECGTFAVRVCRRCSTPLCGDHSVHGPTYTPWADRWLCGPCADLAEAEDRRNLAAQQQAAEQKRQDQAREDWERYRALPPATAADIVGFLRGTATMTDGTTHQIMDWSNSDIAALIRTHPNIGATVTIEMRHGRVSGQRTVLEPDGTQTAEKWTEPVTEYGSGHWSPTTGSTPTDRFNGPLRSGRDREAGVPQGPGARTAALPQLRDAIPDALTRTAGERSAHREDIAWLTLGILAAAAIAALIIWLLL